MTPLFPPVAAILIKEYVLQGFKAQYIQTLLEMRGFHYTKEQVQHRITYVRHQEGLKRPKYLRNQGYVPRDHGYHVVDNYVPSHVRRARFDPEAHREARHYKGTFEL